MPKLPLRLPVCPSCGARFFYHQAKQSQKEKVVVCPNCKKKLRVAYKRNAVLLVFTAILIMIASNFLILAAAPYMNFLGLFLVTIVGVGITYFLIPYTVRYK